MASEIKVPTLGESVAEATVAKWMKQAGETVAADEPLVELETDKVTLEVNAPAAGKLAEILAAEGETVAVGAVLGRIEEGAGAAKAKPAAAPKEKKEAPARVAAAPAAATPAGRAAAGKDAGAAGAAVDIVVPALGESVTEATVAQWLKQRGDKVAADEPLVELETEKVTLEVRAPAAGTLAEIAVAAGETASVGARLGRIAAGAGADAQRAAAPKAAAQAAAKPAGEAAEPAPARTPGLEPSLAPRREADGKIGAAELRRFVAESTPSAAMTLSPAVARLVEEKGLDPARIRASGPQGRITKEDVLAVVEGRAELLPRPVVAPRSPAASAPAAQAAPRAVAPDAREERVRMSKLRQTIARRLKEAQNTAAMLTTFNEVDMSSIMALRNRYKEAFEKKHGVKLGFMSFFAKAVVQALKELPAVNGRVEGEEIVYNKFYDIGMAVSTPQGLMVPVIRDCDGKSFAEIELALADLARRARDGKLALSELQGGSFTITNGGVFGSLLSTPILNAPQSGILGLHKIEDRPVAVSGKVEIRPMMYLALSYDHRIVDGREAVTFLVRIKEFLEDPERLLLDI